MSLIGVIANPESGKDIRRLVSAGSIAGSTQKVQVITRLFIGMAAAGVEKAVMMPDIYGIGREARTNYMRTGKPAMDIEFLDIALKGKEEDSQTAAELMRRMGVDCMVALGGDGTSRLVAKGCGPIPMLPLSMGTNNVFPYTMESTIAGLAAGLFCSDFSDVPEAAPRRKRLDVMNGAEVIDSALIDIAVTTDSDIGSKAVWDLRTVKQIVQSRASLRDIGLSSIGGVFFNIGVDDPRGAHIELGGAKNRIMAPIGPGMIGKTCVKHAEILNFGDEAPVKYAPSILALDGERKIRAPRGHNLTIRLNGAGPRVINVDKVMELSTEKRLFTR